jgi:hypothetical protein
VWLEEGNFKDLCKAFKANKYASLKLCIRPSHSSLLFFSITGESLVSLTDADLLAMKIDKLGVRKALLKRISDLSTNSKTTGGAEAKEKKAGDDDSSMSSSSKSTSAGVQFKVVVTDGTGQGFVIGLLPDERSVFSKLQRKLERRLGYTPVVSLVMDDSSVVTIEDQSDWAPLWTRCMIRLFFFSFFLSFWGVSPLFMQIERQTRDAKFAFVRPTSMRSARPSASCSTTWLTALSWQPKIWKSCS